MYAIVEIGGQSHKATQGSEFLVNLINEEKGTIIDFNQVIMISDDGTIDIGTPYLPVIVKAEIIEAQVKGKKITIFKYKNKTNHHVRTGHRQLYTLIKILDIKK